MNESLKSDVLLQVLFIFLLVHSGPIASLWSRQSCIFEDKQRGLKFIDEGSGPDPAISHCLFVVSSSTEIMSSMRLDQRCVHTRRKIQKHWA